MCWNIDRRTRWELLVNVKSWVMELNGTELAIESFSHRQLAMLTTPTLIRL